MECAPTKKQHFLLPISAARGGKLASDALQTFMSFSTIRYEERQCQGSSKRERLGAFLGYFLPRGKK